MKNTLSIRGRNRALLFTIATVFAAGILLMSCGGGYGGGGDGTSGPGQFMLSTPDSGTTVGSLTPTLTWTASAGATSYTVQVDQTGNFTGTFDVNVSVGNVTTYTTTTLTAATTYHWRVIAYNYYGTWIAGPFTFGTP